MSSPTAKEDLSPTAVINLKLSPPIAIITLNNPRKLNALNQDDYYRISCLLQDVAVNPDITVTILTGTGRFFSAGADVSASRPSPLNAEPTSKSETVDGQEAPHAFRRDLFRRFLANNLDITRSFYTHPKILVTALNGPAVGLSAALIGFSDFIYATPNTFLLTPFSSLGLVAEGGSSIGFVNRMGISLANEALIMSRRIQMPQLLSSGFVNKEFPANEQFLDNVIAEVNDKLGPHLNAESMLKVKALIRERERAQMDAQNVKEVIGGVERFISGAPQEEFRKIASGQKRHKL